MRLVLITGASSGVGAATARTMAARGDRVVLVARSTGALNALAAEIGPLAVPAPCDAADPDQVADLAARITADHGIPDVLVHCAGAGQWKTLQDTAPQEAVMMMQAPYFAAFNVTRAFLPDMLARGSGVILHVNSPACLIAWPSSVGYTAARAALKGFHEALSQDLAGTGVRSCHVIFGRIDSEYFTHNPGVVEKMPALAKTIPTLTTESCAQKLWQLSETPRHQAVFPAILGFYCLSAAYFPGLTRWLLRL